MKYTNQKGDTLVEVLLALSVLSLVLFTSWAVVNRATQIGTAARQRVSVVDQLKEQAELIQAQRDSDDFLDGVMSPGRRSTDDDIDSNACANTDLDNADIDTKKFHFTVNGSGDIVLQTGTKVASRAEGGRVWVQYTSNGDDEGYVDFYIRACWRTSGGQQRTDTSQFILRVNK